LNLGPPVPNRVSKTVDDSVAIRAPAAATNFLLPR
jgi:hypothetical protein